MKDLFSPSQQIKYYVSFLRDKVRILVDCSVGKKDIFVAEAIWLLETFLKKKVDSDHIFRRDYFETKFGKFFIKPCIMGAYIVSPAFERRDIDYLIHLVEKELVAKKRVLFIDVGAYFGTYTVSLGNALRRFNKLDIIAFEPDANNFYDNNFTLLKKNIALNRIKRTKIYKVGLGSTNSKKANKFGIKTKKLDSILKHSVAASYDAVFMKIDIEGFEVDALKGSRSFINNCNEFTLLIEDYIAKGLRGYLEKYFLFLKKLSPQNSFWQKL